MNYIVQYLILVISTEKRDEISLLRSDSDIYDMYLFICMRDVLDITNFLKYQTNYCDNEITEYCHYLR